MLNPLVTKRERLSFETWYFVSTHTLAGRGSEGVPKRF